MRAPPGRASGMDARGAWLPALALRSRAVSKARSESSRMRSRTVSCSEPRAAADAGICAVPSDAIPSAGVGAARAAGPAQVATGIRKIGMSIVHFIEGSRQGDAQAAAAQGRLVDRREL